MLVTSASIVFRYLPDTFQLSETRITVNGDSPFEKKCVAIKKTKGLKAFEDLVLGTKLSTTYKLVGRPAKTLREALRSDKTSNWRNAHFGGSTTRPQRLVKTTPEYNGTLATASLDPELVTSIKIFVGDRDISDDKNEIEAIARGLGYCAAAREEVPLVVKFLEQHLSVFEIQKCEIAMGKSLGRKIKIDPKDGCVETTTLVPRYVAEAFLDEADFSDLEKRFGKLVAWIDKPIPANPTAEGFSEELSDCSTALERFVVVRSYFRAIAAPNAHILFKDVLDDRCLKRACVILESILRSPLLRDKAKELTKVTLYPNESDRLWDLNNGSLDLYSGNPMIGEDMYACAIFGCSSNVHSVLTAGEVRICDVVIDPIGLTIQLEQIAKDCKLDSMLDAMLDCIPPHVVRILKLDRPEIVTENLPRLLRMTRKPRPRRVQSELLLIADSRQLKMSNEGVAFLSPSGDLIALDLGDRESSVAVLGSIEGIGSDQFAHVFLKALWRLTVDQSSNKNLKESMPCHPTYTLNVPNNETETETEIYTVQVPVIKQVEESYTVQVPRVVTEQVPYTVKKTVYDDVTNTVTVQVPKTVTEDVAYTVQVPKTITEDVAYTVQVPNTVTEQVAYTVQVPKTVTEEVAYTVQVPSWVDDVQTYMVKVPVTSQEQVPYTVQVPVYSDEQVPYTVQVPVYSDEVVNYTVKVPYTEARTGSRNVCRRVPVTTTRTVCRDMGSYQTITEEVPVSGGCGSAVSSGCGGAVASSGSGCGGCGGGCGGCGGCGGTAVASSNGCGGCGGEVAAPPATRTVCRKVWVPNVVTEEVPVTTYQNQMSTEEYTYNVALYRDDVQSKKVKKVSYNTETRYRTVKKCSMTTETRTRRVKKVTYNDEQRTRTIKKCENTETRTRPVSKKIYETETRTRPVSKTVMTTEDRQVTSKVARVVEEQATSAVSKTVYDAETKTRTKNLTDMVTEPRSKDVSSTVMVSAFKERTFDLTGYSKVTEKKVGKYTVQVPRTDTVEVSYTVEAPKTVLEVVFYTVQVPRAFDEIRRYIIKVPVTTRELAPYTVQVPVYTDHYVPYLVPYLVLELGYTDKVVNYTEKGSKYDESRWLVTFDAGYRYNAYLPCALHLEVLWRESVALIPLPTATLKWVQVGNEILPLMTACSQSNKRLEVIWNMAMIDRVPLISMSGKLISADLRQYQNWNEYFEAIVFFVGRISSGKSSIGDTGGWEK